MKPLALIAATALAGLYASLADAQPKAPGQVFPAVRGVSLMDQHAKLYGGMPDANAAIAQWNIPQNLPPLAINPSTGAYQASNSYAAAQYQKDGSVALSQNGRRLICEHNYKGGRQVDEFDFFFSPPRPTRFIPLSGISNMVLAGTVTASGDGVFDSDCALTIGTVMDAIVLTDVKTHQVLFYQIKLGAFGANGKPAGTTARPSWFATGKNKQTLESNTFGYDTQVWSDFGLQTLPADRPTTYKIVVLPKLKATIAAGAKFGMDQNLADWAVSGRYTGSNLFGHTGIHVQLANLSLTEQPAP